MAAALGAEPESTYTAEPSSQAPTIIMEADLDSDSGNLVIAETPKEGRSPRKRRSRAQLEDLTPTRTPSTRVKGRGMAYLIAMEKGGGKKRMAQAQAQAELKDLGSSIGAEAQTAGETDAAVQPKEDHNLVNDKEVVKEAKESKVAAASPAPAAAPPATKPKSAKRESGTRKSYGAANISSPLLKEPFKNGWRREVVYRATVDPGTKTLCDVYYYTPDNKKLRSGREVSEYLDKSDSVLTVENFTFFKEPIGMDQQQEILRYAKQRRDDGGGGGGGGGGDKQISKKERALKAREEELRRNLQELGEDVAAITGQATSEAASLGDGGGDADSGESPSRRGGKRGAKADKQQFKIKLWGSKGLKSKENAEPRDDADAAAAAAASADPDADKMAPLALLPEDIQHLFAPHVRGRAAARRGLGRTAPQGLETVNSKRFVSIGNSGGGVTTTTTTTTTAGAASPVAAAAASTGGAGVAMPPAALTASSPVTSPAAAAAPAADADAAEGPTGLHQAVKRPLQSPDSHSDAVMSPRASPKRVRGASSSSSAVAAAAAAATSSASAAAGSGAAGTATATAGSGGAVSTFPTDQFVSFVSHAYHGLLHVFRYLTVQELMAAAGVCKLWRELALHHSHWRVVRLKNSRVYDWTLFASHLRRAGTQQLDMRKMLFVASREDTWANVASAASHLSEIRRVDFCKCPVELVETLTGHCPRLHYIDATSISSPVMGLSMVSSLARLEELKLRSATSTTGLTLADDGLAPLAGLHRLRSLSLTTVVGLAASQLDHLVGLEHLESLELGDCAGWTSADDYAVLARLPQLRHLRLEQSATGGATPVMPDLAALKGLEHLNHLELVGFGAASTSDADAGRHLVDLANLRRLLVIPHYAPETLKETVQQLFASLSSLKGLQQLHWVVTDEALGADGHLPQPQTPPAEADAAEGVPDVVSVDELQELLRRHLVDTNVRVVRLPQYATLRYSLSSNQED